MAGEVSNIAEVANRVADDIFKWFRWEKIPVMDENFPCHKEDQHKKTPKKNNDQAKHQHPVDVVFRYFDPYLNKFVLLNTDLKSYSKKSITSTSVISALESLAKTIDCARGSNEWQKKYILDNSPCETRGMLFIYNHDDGYDKDFSGNLKSAELAKLPVKQGQVLHIIDPERIRMLTSVVADMMKLYAENEFPINDYTFWYPELYLHKTHGDSDKYPATIEMLCSPYFIIKHGELKKYNEKTCALDKVCGDGYVIYYNQSGTTEYEFMYLFDTLSRFQILSSKSTIKIRVINSNPDPSLMSNYKKAINLYVGAWGFDEFKRMDLDRIDFNLVNVTVPNYMPGILAWRV